MCPDHATATAAGDACHCDTGYQEDPTGKSCEAVPPEEDSCRAAEGGQVGNPILPATGEKYRFEEDLTDGGTAALSFSRIYRSTWASNANLPSTGMGKGWTHNHDMSLRATPKSAPITVSVATAEGYTRGFIYDKESTARWKPTNSADTLFATIEGGWAYTRADDDTRFVFDAAGRLLSRTARNGWTTAYARDASGRLTTITNPFGRSLRLSYDDQGRIASVSAPDARTLNYSYDAAGRLTAVRYPDSRTRGFLYENAAFPNALTGLMDENNARFATFTYDAQGRAVSTELAGSAERYEVSYFDAVPGMAFVTDPLGTFRSFGYGTSGGRLAVTSSSSPTGRAGAGAAASRVQDANGLITRQIDFQGTQTNIGWDTTRRLPLSVTRGTDPSTTYTITTDWHPTLSLPLRVSEPGRTVSYTYDDLGRMLSQRIQAVAASSAGAEGRVTQETSADIGSRVAQYDALGLPAKIVDALGQATTVVRDLLGRPTLVTYADGQTATLRYDLSGTTYNTPGAPLGSVGHLSELTDRSGTTIYQRDGFGRVVRKTQKLANGMTQALDTSYTPAGQIDTVTYPGATTQTLRHVYDATGRLVRLNWNGQPLLTNITWTPLGQPAGWTWAGGGSAGGVNVATTRSYDTAGRLTQVSVAGQTVLAYRYDAAGRITAIDQLLASPTNAADPNAAVTLNLRSWLAGYDLNSRLTSFGLGGTSTAGTPTTVSTISFTYDANGNRISSTQTQGALTTSRAYKGVVNRLTGFTQTTGGVAVNVAYAIDANGNLTSDGLHGYAYDATGRLSTATTGATVTSPTTRYAHNALGQRVFKTEALYPSAAITAGSTALTAFSAKGWAPTATNGERVGFAYVYDEQGTLMGEYGAGGAKSTGSRQYVWLPTPAGPMPVATIKDGTTVQNVTADHLNTPRRVAGADGTLLWQWPYSAFGEDQPTVAERRFASVAAVDGDMEFNLRYPGQYFDKESKLHYNGFRTYDPAMGRYTQADPIGLNGGPNRFGYVGGNALRYSDSNGLSPLGDAGAFVGTWGGRAIGAAGGELIFPAGGGVVGGLVGGQIGSRGGRVAGEWMNSLVYSNSNPFTGDPGSEQTCENKKRK